MAHLKTSVPLTFRRKFEHETSHVKMNILYTIRYTTMIKFRRRYKRYYTCTQIRYLECKFLTIRQKFNHNSLNSVKTLSLETHGFELGYHTFIRHLNHELRVMFFFFCEIRNVKNCIIKKIKKYIIINRDKVTDVSQGITRIN